MNAATAAAPRRIEHALGWHMEDLSAFEFRLVIPGRIIVKKNNITVQKRGPKASIGPTTVYRHWETDAAAQLMMQWRSVFRTPIPAEVPLNLRVISYLPNRQGWPDLVATYEGPQDVLEAHKSQCLKEDRKKPCERHSGVITNDRWIFGHKDSERRIDADNPRVELTITRHIGTPDPLIGAIDDADDQEQ